jgi:hypothetical protein
MKSRSLETGGFHGGENFYSCLSNNNVPEILGGYQYFQRNFLFPSAG